MEILGRLRHFANRPTRDLRHHNPSQVEIQLFTYSISSSQKIDTAQITQNRITPIQKKEQPEARKPPFFLTPTPPKIKLLTLGKMQRMENPDQLDIGWLVGVMNHSGRPQTFIRKQIWRMQVGKGKEIESITAIRQNALDTLMIFWQQKDWQDNLWSFHSCKQKLLFVIQPQNLQSFIGFYEDSLLDRFGDRLLNQFLGKLGVNVFWWDNQVLLNFQSEEQFRREFTNFITNKYPHFRHLDILPDLISLEEYFQLKTQLQSKKEQKQIFDQLQTKALQEYKLRQQKQQWQKINHEIRYENEEEQKIQPTRKNNSIQTQLYAQYFQKKQNEKDNRDSNKKIQCIDFYYLIEQYNQNSLYEQEDKSSSLEENQNVPKNHLRRIHRSKSWNQLTTSQEQELDQEFFTKY